MTSPKRILLFGLLLWIIPFLVALLIFPLRENDRPLFESIMPVIVAFSVVVCSILYARKNRPVSVGGWSALGVLWFLISVAIDLAMFSSGPMKMSFLDYCKDIGLTYLIIPIVTTGFGAVLGIGTPSPAHEAVAGTVSDGPRVQGGEP